MADEADVAELERLRRLLGPSETSYAQLATDRDEAVRVARESLAEEGRLRGHIAVLGVQLARARQDRQYLLVRSDMHRAQRVEYLARRRISVSVTPRLVRAARRLKHAVIGTRT